MEKYLKKHKIIIVCAVLISFAVCAVAPAPAMAATYNLSGNQCYYGDGTCSMGEAMGKNAVDILVDVFWPDGIELGMMGWKYSTGKTTPILKLLYDYYDTIGMIYKVFDDLEQVIRKDELKAILADGRDAAARLAVIEEDAVKYGKYLQSNQMQEPDYGPFYNRTLAVRNTAQQIRCDSVKFSGNSRKALLEAAEALDKAALDCYDNVKVIVENMRTSTPQQTTEEKKSSDDILKNGTYIIKATVNNKVINVRCEGDPNKAAKSTLINVYKPTGDISQAVYAESLGDNTYRFHFGSVNGVVMDVRNSQNGAVAKAGAKIQIYPLTPQNAQDQCFNIIKKDKKYYIVLAADKNLALTVTGTEISLEKLTYAANQVFEFTAK